MAGHHSGYVFPPPASMLSNYWPNQMETQPYYGNIASQHSNVRTIRPSNDFAPRPFQCGMFPHQPAFNNFNQPQNTSPFNNQRPCLNNFGPGTGLGFSVQRPRHDKPFHRSQNHAKHQFGCKPHGKEEMKAANNSYLFCEPCEKEFKCLKDKEAHLKGHAQCEADGCTFIASRKTLKLHFIQHHEVGKFRICLTTDEEIEKWREERKKNFPSKSRAAKRKVDEQKKIESGSVLKTKEFSYRGRGSWRGKGRDRQLAKFSRTEYNKHEVNNNIEHVRKGDDDGQMSEEGTRRSNGSSNVLLSVLSNTTNVTNEAEFDEHMAQDLANVSGSSSSTKTGDVKSVNSSQALSSLFTSYLSSGESNDDQDEKDTGLSNETVAVSDNANARLSSSITNFNSVVQDVDTPELLANGSPVDLGGNPDTDKRNSPDTRGPKRQNRNKQGLKRLRKRKRNNVNRSESNGLNEKMKRNKPSLLEMLLADDIRQERNKILQCIRTIVKKNFFLEK